VTDLDSGLTLAAVNPHRPLPPASTVKVMTALVTLKRADLAAPVTVSALAAATPGSRMGLTAGQTLSARDLLYGLLLPSGNDAAMALAEHVAGDSAAFVTLMQDEATALGLTGSHFTNPHGLDEPAETITAADLMTVTRAALAYPIFREIVAQPTATVAGRLLSNTNDLLRVRRGADGVKTGTTIGAGECLVASVTTGGHRVLVVVLGSQDRYTDTAALLDFAAAGWRWGAGGLPDDALAWEFGPDGQAYRLRTAGASQLFLPAWQWSLAQPVRALDPAVPLTGTLPVGALKWLLGDRELVSVPLTVWEGP
jgi:D-alanyl-D-alanine carboxypeptidase (penicillin-binding protein 5/6)